MVRLSIRSGLLLLPLTFLACGQKNVPPPPPPNPAPFGGTGCAVTRTSTEPDLMAWDAASRAKLSLLRSQGVIAVRYKATGCNVELEVLPNCIGKGRYAYASYPGGTETKISRNDAELYAALPLGAARLGGRLRQGRALRTDYTLVGMQSLPAGDDYKASDLRGPGCEKATHVVSTIYVGGFALVQGDQSAIEASASVFGASAGASEGSSFEQVAREGIPRACEKAQLDGTPSDQCAVPLRLALLAIAGRAEGECPVGKKWDGAACVDPSAATRPPKPTVPTEVIPPPRAAEPVAAAPQASPDPEAASALVEAALHAEQDGRLEECIEKSRKALTLGEAARPRLFLSSCEARRGQLVDALKDAQKALEEGIKARDVSVMQVARARVKGLLDRIPHVTFAPVAGAQLSGVSFDDRPVPLDALTKKFSVDPGRHVVAWEGSSAGRPFKRTTALDIEEKDFKTISLDTGAP